MVARRWTYSYHNRFGYAYASGDSLPQAITYVAAYVWAYDIG